jgi:DHA2 family multidrug resistance protein-like MFS transporter
MAELGLPTPQRYWSAATIWLALTISVLDGSIVIVALPTIAGDLSVSPAEAIWVVNAYQLAIVVSLLPLASLGQMIGFRRVFQAGVLVFGIASLGCTFANSLPMLAVARAVQGLGGAGMMSQTAALARHTYPPNQLGFGLGLNALVASAAAALGPTVASGILAVGPWQWLFAVNVPIGALTFWLGRRSLPDNPKSGSLDLWGTLLNVLMFGLGFVGIDLLTQGGSTSLGLAALALGGSAGILLVRHSRAQSKPIVPIDLLKDPTFALTVATSIASYAAQILALVSLPFLFEGIMHRSQIETGLLMTPWPLAIGIGAPIAGLLADKMPAAILCSAGLSVLAAGLALLAVMSVDATSFQIGWRMAVCGLGFGFFQTPNSRAMLGSAPLERSGAAGGMLVTARLTGQAIGATLAAMLFHMVTHSEIVGLAAASVVAGIAALVSLARMAHPVDAKPSKSTEVPTAP